MNYMVSENDPDPMTTRTRTPNQTEPSGVITPFDDRPPQLDRVSASGPLWLFDRKHERVVGGRISRRDWRNNSFDVDSTGPGASSIVPDFYNWTGNIPQPRVLPFPTYSNKEVHDERGFYAATRLNVHDRLKVLLGTRVGNYEANRFIWGNRDRASLRDSD